ncbi:MAG: hypothetical protein ACXWP4_02475 [Polyangiales bacterium]
MMIAQEHDQVRGRLVVAVFVVSVLVGFVGVAATAGLLSLRPHGVANAEPRQAEAPEARTAQEKRLHGYGYVDRGKGIAHIPIERAIEIVAKETP